MGGLKKLFSSVTDAVGLTDTKALEEQQRQYEQQQKQLNAQAALEANNAVDNTTNIDSGGAAQMSADAITGDQKKRRAASVSSVLGL